MKVKVAIKVRSKTVDQVQPTFEVVAFVADTVSTLKDRILSIHNVPFPEQLLILDNKTLDNSWKLSECGVIEGSTLDFVVHASEATLKEQLKELLLARPVAAEELAMLYTHKHGALFAEALEMVGFSGSLNDFLNVHSKSFVISNGLVSPVSTQSSLRVSVQHVVASWTGIDAEANVPAIVKVTINAEETIGAIARRVAAAGGVPTAYPEIELCLAGRALSDASTVSNEGLSDGTAELKLVPRASESSLSQQLLVLLDERGQLPLTELALLFSCRHGANADLVAAEVLGASRRTLADFLRSKPALFALDGGCVSRAPADRPPKGPATAESARERCLAWHNKECSRQFRADVARALSIVTTFIMEASFLNIDRVVAGGAAGKDTAVAGVANAELTLFIEGLPATFQGLSGLLEATASGLRERLAAETDPPAMRVLGVSNGAVQLEADGLTSLELRLAPAFRTHGEALAALRAAGNTAPPGANACLAEQEVRFVKKQPEVVKTVARLLKLWREERPLQSEASKPGDRLLEVMAAHAAAELPAGSACDKVLERVVALMQNFENVEVVWRAPFYGTLAIPEDIRTQRPLVMDPINPFVNLAAEPSLDVAELSRRALVSGMLENK